MAEIAYVARGFQNPLYAEEMNILDFLQQPDVTLVQALLLKFKPVNMDVLPLYIVLLAAVCARCSGCCCATPTVALALSVALYVLTWEFGWNLPAYPSGALVFQSVRLAAAVRVRRLVRARRRGTARPACCVRASRWCVAIAYLLFAFCHHADLALPAAAPLVPKWLAEHIYPIDKTNLDVLRFAHFLALAAVTVYFIPRDWPPLNSPWLRPAILCGQHSLEIFCLGVFSGVRRPFREGGDLRAVFRCRSLVSVLGILIMIAVAWLLSWYKSVEGRSSGVTSETSRTPTSQEARHEDAPDHPPCCSWRFRCPTLRPTHAPDAWILRHSGYLAPRACQPRQGRRHGRASNNPGLGFGSSVIGGADGVDQAYPGRLEEVLPAPYFPSTSHHRHGPRQITADRRGNDQ